MQKKIFSLSKILINSRNANKTKKKSLKLNTSNVILIIAQGYIRDL